MTIYPDHPSETLRWIIKNIQKDQKIIKITGRVGSGKTRLLHHLVNQRWKKPCLSFLHYTEIDSNYTFTDEKGLSAHQKINILNYFDSNKHNTKERQNYNSFFENITDNTDIFNDKIIFVDSDTSFKHYNKILSPLRKQSHLSFLFGRETGSSAPHEKHHEDFKIFVENQQYFITLPDLSEKHNITHSDIHYLENYPE